MQNDFLIDPPEYKDMEMMPTDMPISAEAAWLLQLIEVRLPKEIRSEITIYLKTILSTAPKTNILRHEIPLHLRSYDLIWTRYQMTGHKLDNKLFVLKESLRHTLELELNRSSEGWQGELLFTKRYDVTNRQDMQRRRRLREIFMGRKEEPPQSQEGTY